MEKQSSEKRFALLIDADNVSSKYIKPITDELSNYGTVTYKRIYGDWTLTLHSKWKEALLENSITPIQQFGYTQGKNATDSAMIIDAMDILYTRSVEGFCIVSSDSDFTRLASRIRESGLTVIGMGEKKTPTAFRKACDIFTTLELLLGDSKAARGKSRPGSGNAAASPNIGLTKDELEQAVVNIITDNQNNGKSTGLGEVGSRLLKRYPDFDVRGYGTNLLSKLLDEFASVQITKDGSSVTVELAGDADRERKGRGKDASCNRAGQPNAEASTGQSDEQGAAPSEATTSSSSALSAVDKDAPAETNVASAAKAAAEKKPRRSTHMAAKRTAEQETPKEPETSNRPETSKEAFEVSTTSEPLSISLDEESASTSREKQAKETSVDNRPGRSARKRASLQSSTVEHAANEEGQSAPKQTPRTAKQGRARASTTQPSEQRLAEHERAEQQDESQETTAARKALQNRTSHQGNTSAAVGEQPAAASSGPEAFIRQTAANAGPEGFELAALGKRVRAKFRTFKLRNLGYSQFRPYVADLEGVTIQERDGRFYACVE